ncbi:MAG: hypothetical protein JO257_26160 [Deltaproteobacteria bacterium]|nr:hypothetical protein [Deltaproteobacteria bacterium]
MRTLSLMLGLLVACGGTQAKTTINTQQDYETTVSQIIDEVIEVFKADGINCQLVNSDLKSINKSQKLAAAKDWASKNPDAKATAKQKIAARRAELDKAAEPAIRQCGMETETVLGSLTQQSPQ